MLLVSSILPFTTTGSLSGTFSLLKSNWKREREREERGREAVKGGGWLREAREEGRKERGKDRGRKEVKEDTEGKLSMTPWHCEGGRRDVMLTPSPCLSHSNYTKVSIPLHINIALQSYRPPPPSILHSQANLHKTMATDKYNTLLWTITSESSTNSRYVPGRLDGAPGPFQTHGGSHTSAIGSPEPRINNQSISTQNSPVPKEQASQLRVPNERYM